MEDYKRSDAPPVRREAAGAFRVWLILGTVLLNAIVIAVGVHGLLASRERAVEQVRLTTGNLANLLRDNIGDSARGIDLALASIAESLERMQRHRHWRDDEIEDLLETHNRRHPEVAAFRLTDARGDVRWGKGVERKSLVNFSDRDYFRGHRAEPGRHMLVTEPLQVRVQKTWAIVFSRSYRAPDGSFAGVVTAAVPIGHFTQMLSRLDLGAHGSAVIRHENFALVTRFPPVDGPGGATGDPRVSPQFKALFETGVVSGAFHTPQAPDGVERTYAFRRIAHTPLIVNVGMAPRDYFASWQREARNTALLLVAFLLVSAGAAWMIWRYWRQHWWDRAALQAREAALLEAKLAAEAANIAKSRFLATISHELRTPLNGVLGMAQLLLGDEVSVAERQSFARTIYHSGKTLLVLLNDILDLSKVEAGRMELHPAPFAAAALLRETGALFAAVAGEKGLQLRVRWLGDARQRYDGDAQRLLQMLSNLVNNAIKFTEYGEVLVEGREVSRDGTGARLEFSVADTGIGIAAEHLPQLFKPFSQVDSSSTRQFGGTGLGLSIVRCMAELMDGEVGVDSVPGQGSRFWVRVRVDCLEIGEDTRGAERATPTKTA